MRACSHTDPASGGQADTSNTASPGLLATVATTNQRLNLRSGPRSDAWIVAKGEAGARYTAIARDESADWILLSANGAPVGWGAAAWLKLDGDAATLPVSSTILDLTVAADTLTAEETVAASDASESVEQQPDAPTAVSGAQTGGLQGTLVFQQSAGGAIYAFDLAIGALQPLTYGFDPAISPHGTQVAFVRHGGESGLYLINIDGSDERVIFDERGSLSSPKWNTDGSAIVFARNDEYIECYQVGPRECLVESAAVKRVPKEMLDQLPFVKEYEYRLSVVDADGTNFRDLPALNSAKAPDWSSTGVVYQSSAGIQRTDDANGASNETVADDPVGRAWADPDASPDGSAIIYQVQGAAQWDLWIMNGDGSNHRGLTRPATTLVETLPSNVAAAWSPDGSHIVYLSNRTETNSAGAWRLCVMEADGSNQQLLPIDVAVTYAFGAEQGVDWGS